MSAASPSQDILDSVSRAGRRVRQMAVDATAEAYVRQRDLPRIVAVWPKQLADMSIKGTEGIIIRLEKEALAYDRMARDFPHHYDTNRHMAILGALKAEKVRLAHLQNCAGLARIVGAAA